MDGAISRLDTMNNFPNVMSNLGIGVEESKEAIKDLSERLKGIPTTLDSAALSVERFTSKNGDVKKSVEIFTAINNALLAGGASSEIQASALEQLSQAYAKGKPDMVEWRSIQTAMPAQLKQVAEAMGMTTDELGEGLRKGGVEMDDFIETMIRLNKEGTGQFQSFEKQAKNATGGIKTSITNAKTAVVRGVANIVSAIDDGLSKTSLGGLGKVISNIGSIAEKALKKVAESISKINFNQMVKKVESLYRIYIPKVKSALTSVVNILKEVWSWCIKNKSILEVLIKAIISLIAAIKIYKGVLIAIQGINLAKNILGTVTAFTSLIPAVKSVKDAMLLLNMAFNANPAGILIASITGLTVALLSLKNTQSKEQKQAEEFAQTISVAKQTMEEYNAKVDETMNKELSHINEVSSLRNELSKLVDENGQVKKGYESRVSFILNELNNALGTEYKMTGNIIQGYKNLQQEIDKTIDKKKAEIILNAEEEKYKEAIEKQGEAVENLSTAQNNLNNLLKEKNMTLGELEKYYEGSNSKEAEKVHNTINAYNDALDTVQNYTDNIKAYEDDYSLYTQEKYDEIGKHVTSSTQNWTNSSLEEIKNGISKQKETLDNYQQIYAITGNKIANEQETQAKNNLQNLADELVSRTKTIGDLSADEVSAWQTLAKSSTKIYSEELEKLPETTREKIEQATGYVADSSLPDGLAGLGSTGSSKYNTLLNLKRPTEEEIGNVSDVIHKDTTVNNAAKMLANNANEGFNDNVNGSKWGTDLAQNIATGMESKQSKSIITRASEGIAGIIKSIMGHSVPAAGPLKDELTYMPDMINNLVEGIEKNKYKVEKATNRMAQGIKEGFNLDGLNNEIMREMNKAVAIETGSINATASVKANNSMLSVIQASFNIDGSVDIDGKKAGRILAPSVVKTIKTGGLA